MQLADTKVDVVIDETVDHIQTHAGFLRLYSEKNEIIGDVPIYQVHSILILGSKVNIPASLIKLCSQTKIPIHVLTNLSKHYGSLHFTTDDNVLNRQEQFKCLLNDEWRLYLAKQILHQKILTQLRMTQLWGLFSFEKQLNKNLEKLKGKKTFSGLLGTEGNAAILYWEAFGSQLQDTQFTWPGRVKHPTTDPVNSLLSLGYGLLATQTQTSLTLSGLDPYFGILHTTNPDRPALTYDIMEIYRVLLVDVWVLQLFKNNIFSPDQFTTTQEGICTLYPDAKNEFFRLWFKRLKKYTFSTNFGVVTIQQFLNSNTKLIISWFEKINSHKERNTGRFDRLPQNLIVFKDIKQFMFIE